MNNIAVNILVNLFRNTCIHIFVGCKPSSVIGINMLLVDLPTGIVPVYTQQS